jgi:uncharacterized protein YbcI
VVGKCFVTLRDIFEVVWMEKELVERFDELIQIQETRSGLRALSLFLITFVRKHECRIVFVLDNDVEKQREILKNC